ncbi:hypothetical protein MMC26_004922 [Xylographa opegraphella]|nr:hypothetical protein [Xylographa opegraphella]
MGATEIVLPPLLELLNNSLVLHQICPYIPISGLLNLAATSRSFHSFIFGIPNVFRYLDLSTTKGGAVDFAPIDPGGEVWRSERMDEAVTEEDFFAGPSRGIFSTLRRRGVLQDVQTLILDGLSVPSEVVREIICDPSFNVRILSIKGVKNLNERRLKQVLKDICRPDRPKGTPKLKGLYFFGPERRKTGDSPLFSQPAVVPSLSSQGVTTSVGAQLGTQWNQRSQHALSCVVGPGADPWYRPSGVLSFADHVAEWADVFSVCRGIIAFDGILCRGPRHDTLSSKGDLKGGAEKLLARAGLMAPASATVVLGPGGCQACHSAPEGLAIPGEVPTDYLPLLEPPPRHTSSLQVARKVSCDISPSGTLPLLARCKACLVDRWCEGCNKFWCEGCYQTSETSTYTQMQKVEAIENSEGPGLRMGIKVHLGLCIEDCLVGEMYNGAGSGGMWG